MKTGLNFYTTNIINSAEQLANLKLSQNFKSEWITSVVKYGYKEEVMSTATLDLTNYLKAGNKEYYRIDMYITFEGSVSTTGASPRDYNQGVPFWVEFTNTSTVDEIISAINKTKAFVMDTPLIKAAKAGDKSISFTATQEGVRFKNIDVVKFDNESEYAEFVVSAEITNGTNGFGTYSYLIKNATLPTAANTAWNSKTTMPIVGGKYDQWVIEYYAPAANGSMQHVGGRTESETLHTFWVLQGVDFPIAEKAASELED